MVKLKKTMYSLCPCCNQAPEDIHHILICQDRETLSRSRFIQEIQKSLKITESETSHTLIHQIFDSIAYKKESITISTSFVHQNKLGWDMVLQGFLTPEWEAIANVLKPTRKWKDTLSLMITVTWIKWQEM